MVWASGGCGIHLYCTCLHGIADADGSVDVGGEQASLQVAILCQHSKWREYMCMGYNYIQVNLAVLVTKHVDVRNVLSHTLYWCESMLMSG